MKRTLLYGAAVLFLIISCEKNNTLLEDNTMRFTPQVMNHTKAPDYDNSNLPTEFGVFVNNVGGLEKYSYNNVAVTATDGIYTPSTQMLWQNSESTVNVVAYVPYSADTTINPFGTGVETTLNSQSIAANQRDTADFKASDFLYYKSDAPLAAAAGDIAIPFRHVLSKFKLNLTLGSEFNPGSDAALNPIEFVEIKGLNSTFDWNLATGAVENPRTEVVYTPFPKNYTSATGQTENAVANYEVIIVPQTVAQEGLTIDFIVKGRLYRWVSTKAYTFSATTQYDLNLTIGKDQVVGGDITIGDWGNGNASEDLDTE